MVGRNVAPRPAAGSRPPAGRFLRPQTMSILLASVFRTLYTLLLFVSLVTVGVAVRTTKLPDRSEPLGNPHDPGYVERLRKGEEDLRQFVRWAGWDLERLADEHPRVYNEILSEYVNQVFDYHGSRAEAEAALLAFKERFFWTRTNLHAAWKRIKEWKLREPIEMRQPASEEVTRALLSVCVSWGWWRMGLTIWLAFHCLLRPSDFLPITWEDIRIIKGQLRIGVLVTMGPKTRKTAARRQHVIIEDGFLLRILRALKERCPPKERIIPITYAAFRARLIKLLAALGTPNIITPSSFRAGGATWHWIKRRNFEELRLRGRWLVPKTLEVYIQECTSFLGEASLSDRQLERLAALAREAKEVWKEWLESWYNNN